MSRPSYTEAAAFANRVDNFGTALKTPAHGGPSYKRQALAGAGAYGIVQAREAEYIAEHPRYPDYHYPDDKERDTYYEFKAAMANTEPTGRVMASDRDIQYMIDKKNAQELILFKQFVEDSIPRGTPWAKEYFERFMPGWYQSKIDIIQDKLSIVNRFIDMTIRGPQNIEDMFLLYQLYTGKIALPADWASLIRPASQAVSESNFASGLFNPKKWLKREYMISARNQQFLSNFSIPGVDIKGITDTAGAGVNDYSAVADATAAQALTTGKAIQGSNSVWVDRNFFGPSSMSNRAAETHALLYNKNTVAADVDDAGTRFI